MAVLSLLALLLQSPPSGPPLVHPTAAASTPCAALFRVGFVTDVSQFGSQVDLDGWAGVLAAARRDPCLRPELLRSTQPTDYGDNLETLADHHDDLVIAGSFLLTDSVLIAARERPATRFVLVDPLVIPAARPNLALVAFREDQAAFLAGALAAMVSRTKILGGVYGLEGGAMSRYRRGFERGAATVDASIRVLGAYQKASDGPPFGNPAWGQAQARQWFASGADVIFGAGGTTGQGALLAAADSDHLCIGAGDDAYVTDGLARQCLLTSAITHVDRVVEIVVTEARDGHWEAGTRTFGVADGAVGLAPFHRYAAAVTPEMRMRLVTLTEQLADGTLLEGN